MCANSAKEDMCIRLVYVYGVPLCEYVGYIKGWNRGWSVYTRSNTNGNEAGMELTTEPGIPV